MEHIHLGAMQWEMGRILPRDPRDLPYLIIECGEDGDLWTANVDLFLSITRRMSEKHCWRGIGGKKEETIDNVGAVPREVSADAGYFSAQAVDGLHALGVDPFVAPDQTRHGRCRPAGAPGAHTRQPITQGPDAPEAAYQTGAAALCLADGDGDAGDTGRA